MKKKLILGGAFFIALSYGMGQTAHAAPPMEASGDCSYKGDYSKSCRKCKILPQISCQCNTPPELPWYPLGRSVPTTFLGPCNH